MVPDIVPVRPSARETYTCFLHKRGATLPAVYLGGGPLGGGPLGGGPRGGGPLAVPPGGAPGAPGGGPRGGGPLLAQNMDKAA